MSNDILAVHTPRPWPVVRELDFNGSGEGMFVESIGPFHIEWHDDLNKGNPDRIEADIALASAAPELLAALQAMSAHYSGSLDHQPAYVKMGRAAIAKAIPC